MIILLFLTSFCFAQNKFNSLETKSIRVTGETATTVPFLDASKNIKSSTVTPTELGWLSGVTSSIQTQIGTKINITDAVDLTSTQTITGQKTIQSPLITTPLRLDVKQDTKANLEAYALTTSNGQVVFATDEKKMYQVVDMVLKPIGGGGAGLTNYLLNPNFEDGLDEWTTNQTSGTFTSAVETPCLDPDFPNCAELTLSSGVGYFESISTLLASEILGIQGYVSIWAKTTVSGIEVCSMIDSAERDCVPVVNNDLWSEYRIPSVLGGTNSGVRVKSDTAQTGTVYVDKAGVFINSLTREVDLITDWKTYTPTTQGLGTISSVECLYREAGTSIDINCSFVTGTVSASEARIGLPSGYTVLSGSIKRPVGNYIRNLSTLTKGGIILAQGGHDYVTFGEQAFSGNTVNAYSNASGNLIFNSSEQQLFFASIPVNNLSGKVGAYSENTDWRIDANIGGANPSMGIVAVSSYTGITNSGLDMVLQSGSAPAQIGCSSTNAPTGLTCSSGDESISVAFDPPSTGTYEVCFNVSWRGSASGDLINTFQVVETATNAQTIIAEGGDRIQKRVSNNTSTIPSFVCGVFPVTTTTKKNV